MTKLQRLPDWPERLIEFIEARRTRAFSWGSNDCALFAADAVLSMTGVDLGAEWRGYKSKRKAASIINKIGGMRAFAASLQEKQVGFAQRGDIVLASMEDMETFGVVIDATKWIGPGQSGIESRPMSEAIAVFGV